MNYQNIKIKHSRNVSQESEFSMSFLNSSRHFSSSKNPPCSLALTQFLQVKAIRNIYLCLLHFLSTMQKKKKRCINLAL